MMHYRQEWRADRAAASPASGGEEERTAAMSPAIEHAPLPRYRAWHKVLKVMLPVDAISYLTTENPKGSVELRGYGQCSPDIVALMVQAGFQVKTGTLYDGDIIRDDRCGSIVFRVAYRQDFGFDAYEIGGTADSKDFILDEDGPHLEVLGNIYENPELLA
jgi:hypothetical protein